MFQPRAFVPFIAHHLVIRRLISFYHAASGLYPVFLSHVLHPALREGRPAKGDFRRSAKMADWSLYGLFVDRLVFAIYVYLSPPKCVSLPATSSALLQYLRYCISFFYFSVSTARAYLHPTLLSRTCISPHSLSQRLWPASVWLNAGTRSRMTTAPTTSSTCSISKPYVPADHRIPPTYRPSPLFPTTPL